MRKGLTTGICLALWLATLLMAIPCNAGPNDFQYRALWLQGGLHKYHNWFLEQMGEAAGHGYNMLVFVDYDLQNVESQGQKFFDNYRNVIKEAKKKNIKLVPWHFRQGNPSNENFNLAETLPVKGTKFVVAGNKAKAVADHDVALNNGGFETFTGNSPEGWSRSIPTGNLLIDKVNKKSGEASLCVKNAPAGSFLKQRIKLRPFRAYEISVWFKTSGLKYSYNIHFRIDPQILHQYASAFGKPVGMPTNGYCRSVLSPTMNWTKCVIDFNSLHFTDATLNLVISQGRAQGGNVWMDDIRIREVGLYETVRHQSKPIIVKSADGSKTYQEGKDYIVDPKCNSMTHESYWYEGHLLIPEGSAIMDKQELRVDWSQYGNVRTPVPESDFCLPETWTALEDDIKRIDKLMGEPIPVHTHVSEWRMGGWNEDCQSFSFKTGGEYVENMWRGIECRLRQNGNGCRTIFTESDMFDPFHNGANQPYGTWVGNGKSLGGTYGAYKGLSHEVIVLNWNTYAQRKYTEPSLSFFGGLDPKYPKVKTRQVLNVLDANQATAYCNDLDRLEKKGLEGVVGMYYTDWFNGKYDMMGSVARAFKARGRWPNNPFPEKTCAPLKPGECGVSTSRNAGRTNATHGMDLKAACLTNGTYRIQYSVPQFNRVSLKAFDLQGREIHTLVSKRQTIGSHQLTWNTSALPAGVYFLRLSVDGVGKTSLKQIMF